MKKSLYLLFTAFCVLFSLSSCDKNDFGSSLEGTYNLITAEGEFHEVYTAGEGDKIHGSFVADFTKKKISIEDTIEDEDGHYDEPDNYTISWASGMNEDAQDFLESFLFFPISYEFYADGTVLMSGGIYDPELVDFWEEDTVTISAHYSIKGGVIEFAAPIGEPFDYKIKESGDGFTLEPTKQTLKDYNESLEYDTEDNMSGIISHMAMEWTKGTYQKQ